MPLHSVPPPLQLTHIDLHKHAHKLPLTPLGPEAYTVPLGPGTGDYVVYLITSWQHLSPHLSLSFSRWVVSTHIPIVPLVRPLLAPSPQLSALKWLLNIWANKCSLSPLLVLIPLTHTYTLKPTRNLRHSTLEWTRWRQRKTNNRHVMDVCERPTCMSTMSSCQNLCPSVNVCTCLCVWFPIKKHH